MTTSNPPDPRGPGPEVVSHADADAVAADVAERLVARLAEVQAEGRVPAVALTGGSIAVTLHEQVASSYARDAVQWDKVDFWFGDERFVPEGDPERNAGQARAAMLDHLPVDPDRVHEAPASDGPHGDDIDAAADAYAQELRTHGPGAFDVVMLGVGPDGHVASLFPGSAQLDVDDAITVAVRDSPKPPPRRISLTFPALERSREVWFVVAGEDKADAVRRALASGTEVREVPASRPKGRERTVWFVDRAAASKL